MDEFSAEIVPERSPFYSSSYHAIGFMLRMHHADAPVKTRRPGDCEATQTGGINGSEATRSPLATP
jgi:hypothetical protein